MALKDGFEKGIKFLSFVKVTYSGMVKKDAVNFIETLDAVWKHLMMTNDPLATWWAIKLTTPFVAAFRQKYCENEFKNNTLRELILCVQKPNESVTQFTRPGTGLICWNNRPI
eukprot:TRINITY_DN13775_c0_g1_i2.p1 TRINITY_DN13775_c0_g1~~TRINITY_DN13775_c0_g1_i2.p1  ORF type:complete len:113 (+),score=15.51 TRINITY_DN13775_c0_g1_i2:468-806(+)